MQPEHVVLLAVLAFIGEFIDSMLGMGYGTILVPLLLLAGYEPAEIVPAILLSESATGIMAGMFHHNFGNIELRPGTRDFTVAAILIGSSLLGVFLAVGLAIPVPSWVVQACIGVLVLAIGLVTFKNYRRQMPFSWWRIAGLAFFAAFDTALSKNISGGGYGPVVTGGQLLAGIKSYRAVGICSLAEGVASAAGALIYLLSGTPFHWRLAPSLMLGAVLAVPLAAYAVRRIPPRWLTLAIAGLSTVLGCYILLQILLMQIGAM